MVKKIKSEDYTLKGGANLRFFFKSFRYSEDMDMDVAGISVDVLQDTVMKILQMNILKDTLRTFGIEQVIPPDINRAKQTQTTQRFKVHLITVSGEDLFTKIEFSRRGMKGENSVNTISELILRSYKLPPVLVSHYDIRAALIQKIDALANRKILQARDIFDLYVLNSQVNNYSELEFTNKKNAVKAYDNIFRISFEEFKDQVVSYLSLEDQGIYGTGSAWEEIQLKTAGFIEQIKKIL
ncbi:MAG: nucleotidyl transferase AbiEii/AbiGii toxin family protein [Elusimicrobiota bacterium]